MSYLPQPIEFNGELLQPLSPGAAARALASFKATGRIDLKGCWWPPTAEHLRTCRACQQMTHVDRLEAQVEEARS